MRKCIICRKEKNKEELSDEHVIPDSLNGFYHIFSVCKTCNSYLGREVDSKLVNHYFTSFMRYDLNIKGKKGKLPNPFDGTHILENDEETKVKMILDKEGIPRPYLLPKIKKITNGNKLEIKLSIDSDDKDKINDIMEKILKREKIDKNNCQIITNKDLIFEEFLPVIKMTKELDIKNFKIGLLKIAYEFAVDSIDAYLEDTQAKKISEFLLNIDFKKIDTFFIGNGFEKEITQPLEGLFDFEKKRHLLVLMNVQGLGLVCFISLYKLFSIVVKLSENIFFKDNMIIGINDLEKNAFEKTNIFELSKKNYSPEEIRFKYYFENEKDYNTFLELESSGKFQCYTNNNKFQIYNEKFEIKYPDINDLFQEYTNKNEIQYLGNGINHKSLIEIKEKLYIKVLSIDKFFQIIAIEIEQKLLEKF
jgi:hypothetical protein